MNGQVNATIVDNDGHDAGLLIGNSADGGTLVLTIAANVAIGTDVECRSAILWTDAADVSMKIDGDETAAVAGDFLLLADTYIPVPVKNLKYLRFYGVANGGKVYILYRS
jgi:hypothetical protein